MKKTSKEFITKSMYIPKTLADQLEKLAKREERNFSFIVRRMLETHPDMKKK
jgi:predicted DNA-binding protein